MGADPLVGAGGGRGPDQRVGLPQIAAGEQQAEGVEGAARLPRRQRPGMGGEAAQVAADHGRDRIAALERAAVQVVRRRDRQPVPRQDQGQVGEVGRPGAQGAVEVEDVDVAGLHRHRAVAAQALEAAGHVVLDHDVVPAGAADIPHVAREDLSARGAGGQERVGDRGGLHLGPERGGLLLRLEADPEQRPHEVVPEGELLLGREPPEREIRRLLFRHRAGTRPLRQGGAP